MNRACALFSMIVFLVVSDSARAELRVMDSVEWMTDDARLILRGKVKASSEVPMGLGFYDITIDVLETLHGKHEEKQIVIRSWIGAANEIGGEYLFFLKRGHDVYSAADYRRPVVENRWTQRIFGNGNPYGAIDLDKPSEETVSAKIKLLTTRAQVLAVVAERLKRNEKQPPVIKPAARDAETKTLMPGLGVTLREVPPSSEVYRKLWGGSAVLVYVPTDFDLRETIMREVRDAKGGRNATVVSALANYPGPETEKLLRKLLDDTSEATTFGANGKVVRVTYPVREAAYAALLRFGVRVPQPVLEKKKPD